MTITPKEQQFLDKLRASLNAQGVDQQEVGALLLHEVQKQMEASAGESTLAELFGAMQRGIDTYKGYMDEVVQKNHADFKAAKAELETTDATKANVSKSTEKEIGGLAELTKMRTALESVITNEKTQDIIRDAVGAGLPYESGAPYGLNAAYNATLYTKAIGAENKIVVEGSGNTRTEQIATKGTLNPRYKKGTPGYSHSKFVTRGDTIPDNGYTEYDAVSLIAEDWLRKNNTKEGFTLPSIGDGNGSVKLHPAGSGSANFMQNVELLGRWIQNANKLKNGRGVACDKRKYSGPIIHEGEELILPPGKELTPRMAYFRCESCEIVVKDETQPFTLSHTVGSAAPTIEPYVPHEFVRQATQSTDGKFYRVGSNDHALLALARSGLDEQFSKEYFALKNVVARRPVVTERNAGQIGKDDFPSMEGNSIGKNRQSKLDDGLSKNDVEDLKKQRSEIMQALENGKVKDKDLKRTEEYLGQLDETIKAGEEGFKRHNAGIGGKSLVGRMATGARTGVYFPADAHVVTEGADAGAFERSDAIRLGVAHGGNYAFTLPGVVPFRRVAIPVGKLGGLPVAATLSRPSDQEKFYSVQERWGLSRAHVALAEVNFGGYDNLFTDEQARIASGMESPDRIYAYMHSLNSKKHFVEAMAEFDASADPAAKQAQAQRALVALRDINDNMLVKRADALRIPYAENDKAIRRYFEENGVDLASIDQALPTLPRLQVVDMPQEQLKDQQDYGIAKNRRYRDIKPGEGNTAYDMSEQYAFRTMNHFEAEIAKGKATEPADKMAHEQLVVEQSRKALNTIIANPNAKKEFINFLGEDRNAQIELGNILHDVYRNPKNYGFRNRDEAKTQLLDKLIGDDKQVRKQVTNQGHTSPLPLLLWDQTYANHNPELLGKTVAANLEAGLASQENKYLLNDLVIRISDPRYGVDKQGRTDGRRGAVALLRSYGAELSAQQDGEFGAHYASLAKTLGQDEPLVQKAVLDATAYAERGASGRRVNAVQYLDNSFVDEQRRAKRGEPVDLKQTYDRLYTSSEAQEHGADKLAVQGLRGRPGLARDAVLATVLRHPEVLDVLEDKLSEVAGTSIRNRYRGLRRTLNGVERAADRFASTGDDKDLEQAVAKYGKFFTRMEVNNENNRGSLRNNAWNVLVDAIANDDAMTQAVMETVSNDPTMRDAFLASVPGAIMTTDGVRVTNRANRGGDGRQFADSRGDELYTSRLFAHQTNSKGEVKRGRVDVNLDAVKQVVLAGDAGADAPEQAVGVDGATNRNAQNGIAVNAQNGGVNDLYAKLLKDAGFETTGMTQNNVLGTNPVLYTGTLKIDNSLSAAEQKAQLDDASLKAVSGLLNVSATDAKLRSDLTVLNALSATDRTALYSLNDNDRDAKLNTLNLPPAERAKLQNLSAADFKLYLDGLNALSQIPAQDRAALLNLNTLDLQSQLAKTMIDSKLLNVNHDGDKLLLSNNTSTIDNTLSTAGNISAATGLAKWMALLPLFMTRTTTTTNIIDIPCPTCPPPSWQQGQGR